MLLLDEQDVLQVLDVGRAIDELRGALGEQARGQVQMPPRQTTDVQEGGHWLRISQAFLNGSGYMGFKAMNRAAGLGMRYLINLYRIETGELLSVMDANWITTRRTAATSALGTHLLAGDTERTVGIIGTGVQARAFAAAYASLRSLDEIVVFSPRPPSRDEFARDLSAELGITVTPVESARAVAEACLTTAVAIRAPREPVFEAAWLRSGAHVTGLSSVRAEAREVEDEVWRCSDVVIVDDRGTVSQSGDGRAAGDAGVDLGTVAELWELEAGAVGRESAEQITLFKSAGNAMQDVAVAVGVYNLAVERAIGRDMGAFPAIKPYA
ncbi:MAG TPA: ornithine cyclodeaminase family protein [Acidimicrobiales bacterium]|nr:ornithine cyclodeaminase family protein [Acidimicrobiales bacterium]